ncbi:MAG: c-type cytochrome [Verrucomicrobiae bacterium]|nr:c-type cytochrome [Verrucomicrobiae bacterium]
MIRLGIAVLFAAGTLHGAPLVLSVDRLYRADPAKLAEAGEILLSELNCVNCHQADTALRSRVPAMPGPDLQEAGSRLRGGFLRAWLEDPHSNGSGSRMPDLMKGLPKQLRASNAAALAEFVESLGGRTTDKPLDGDVDRGRSLYHSVGCVACHQPRVDFTETEAGEKVDVAEVRSVSVPLDHVPAKYSRLGLSGFLRNPHLVRPAGRMPSQNLSEQEAADIAAYLMGGNPVSDNTTFPSSDRNILKGRKLFASIGCASCHVVKADGRAIASEMKAPKLSALAGKTGACLSGAPAGLAPHFALDDFQRRALTAALRNLGRTSNSEPIDLLQRRLVALNCYACHQRAGVGGPDSGRLKYFVSSGADLGDEGRVPPTLTGVGRKLREDALLKTIRGEFPVRPYMTTRMPSFAEQDATFLAHGFAVADADPDELPTPRDGEENQVGRNMWGRALVGTTGLSCVTCHQLRGRKSLGIPAIDLAHSAKRLRPEWFRDYLIDPAGFRPGTRMPAFWPEGKPLSKGNGNSTSRQIDSIWVYLNEIDQSRLPEGMESKGNYLLTPSDRPLVFRTFMEGAGMHGIAVGYPERVHAAFDSKELRWTTGWTGGFLDAEGTWDDRFTPLAAPAGENVISIQPLSPKHDDREILFRGYVRRSNYTPELLYRIGDSNIEDQMKPASTGMPGRLIRSVGKVGQSEPIWFEVANGKSIELKASGLWLVDGRLTVGFLSATDAGSDPGQVESRVVKSTAGTHLQFRMPNSLNRSMTYNLSVYYDW